MRDFSKAKRIVIKIGTNTLSKNGGLDAVYVSRIAGQIHSLLADGRQIIVVTSGAIGMGAGRLPDTANLNRIKVRQACAAIGQPLLMAEYRRAFLHYGITVAQVLLTASLLNNRKTYLNLRNSIETLLKLGIVPILNENDSVSTEEIGSSFGDNDKLSALVASKIDADLLIMLSDIDALYNRDPRKHPDAKAIDTVYEITDELIKNVSGKGSRHATGGMKTKIEAAKIASSAGCRLVLANGRQRNVIGRIIRGAVIGTIFMPRRRLSNRKRWILNSTPDGTINIDDGAMRAIRNHKSLLPSGIISVTGSFTAGSVIMLNDQAKAVTALAAAELKPLIGRHSSQIKKELGPSYREEVITAGDIVFLDY